MLRTPRLFHRRTPFVVAAAGAAHRLAGNGITDAGQSGKI